MKQFSSAREVVVTALNSKAFIVAEDGTLQPLTVGQHIPAGVMVQVAGDGELRTEPVSPKPVERADDADTQVVAANAQPSGLSDIEKLQQSILEGLDPTLKLEATAAGGAVATAAGDASGSGNGGFVVVDRTSDSTLATAGFDTSDPAATTTTTIAQPASSTTTDNATDVNNAPTSADLSLDTNEDTPVTGSITATDLDGDSLSYALGSNPANGSVTLNADGTFTYIPAKDFNGSDSFSVTISDGKGGTTTSTVTIGVAPQNDAPTSADLSLNTNEDTPVNGSITATDLDGDSLSYALGANPAHGSVTLNADGTFTYIPAKDFNDSDSFSVTVSDGKGGTTTSTVTIGVAPQNDAPTSTDLSLNTNEDTPVTGSIIATDLDGDRFSYSLNGAPTNGSVTLNADGSFTYTPASNFNGSDSFSVTISDGKGGTTTSTVTIGVAPQNDAPISADLSLNTNEDTPVTGSITATDLDGDSLSYSLNGAPANGSVTLNADGTFTYTPASNFNGSDSFSVTISDGKGGTTTSTVTIGVAPLNDGPVAVADRIVVSEGGTVTVLANGGGSVLTNDSDAEQNTLSAILVTGPQHGSLTLNADGTFSYVHDGSETTADSFSYKVNDGTVDGNTVTVNIEVSPVNDAPTSTNDTIEIQEDLGNTSGRYTLTVDDFGSFNDQDTGDSLQVIRIDSLPANGTFYLNGVAITSAMVSAPGGVTIKVSDISAGNLKFDPADNSDLDSSFKFSVSDGTNWSNASYTTQINITALADRPILNIASSESQWGLAAANNKGNGLVLSYYDNVAGLDHGNQNSNSSNAKDTVKVESVLEATNPKTITTVMDLGVVRARVRA